MAHPCNPVLRRLGQVDCYEFEASPSCIVSSKPVVQFGTVSKQSKNKTKINKNLNKEEG